MRPVPTYGAVSIQFTHNGLRQGNHYAIKQVASVIKEESEEIVVITVYTFFF